MLLSELLHSTDVIQNDTNLALTVSGISYDSRRVQAGDVFVSLGKDVSAVRRYALEAEKKGAVAHIGGERVSGLHIPQLLTSDPRRTLAYAYANFYGNPQNKLKIIGITGTNGKTSSAYMLKTVLAHEGYKTGLIGTVKSMIGEEDYIPNLTKSALDNFTTMTTPDPDALYLTLHDMVERGVEFLVMEVSSHALALEKLAPITFEIGVFTNLSCEHLDFHGGMDDYLNAKAKLFSKCKKGIFNADDKNSSILMKMADCQKITFGIDRKCDYSAVDIVHNGVYGSEYILSSKNARFKIKTTIPGEFTVYNTLAAVSAAREVGVDLLTIQNSIYSLNGICGRLERIDLGFYGNGFSVFIDYAHTPFALENLLKCVNNFKEDGQRVVTLFGCGGDRDKQKRGEMGKIATQMSDFVIITSDNPRSEKPDSIIDDILTGVSGAMNFKVIRNRREAIEYSIINAIKGDIILLVGKGHEEYEIDADGLHPFSEVQIAQQAVRKRK